MGQFVKSYRGAEFYRPSLGRARQAGHYGKWPGAVRSRAEIFRELAPGREDDIAIYEKLYAR